MNSGILMVSFTWSAVTVHKSRADLRAQEERSPLVRAYREHRKKEHGLHLPEPFLHILPQFVII